MANLLETARKTCAIRFCIRHPYSGAMNSATPVFLALLLICSMPVMALVAADSGSSNGEPIEDRRQESLPQTQFQLQQQTQTQEQSQSSPITVDNTTNRLGLPGQLRNEHAEYSPGLGMHLARTDDALRIDADQYVLVDREFENAGPEEQAEMIDEARARLENRTAELEERERKAVREHAADERSNTELIEVLVRNSYEAEMIINSYERLHNRADGVVGYSISRPEARADTAVAKLHRTPIRENLEVTGQTAPSPAEQPVQIRTTEGGYSLLMIEGDSVLIETKRFDHRVTDEPDQFQDKLGPVDQVGEFYPWAAEEAGNNWGSQSYALTQLYSVTYDIGTNHIQIHLDGGTGNVYHEYQELTLSELPVSEQHVETGGGLDVTLNETPADGPAEITVRENGSSDPLPATVTVDGVTVGKTDGEDGTLWYVPPTDDYELEIETSTRAISLDIEDDNIEAEGEAARLNPPRSFAADIYIAGRAQSGV